MRWGPSFLLSAALFCTAAAAAEAPPPVHDRALRTIFSNIDTKFPNAAYWCCGGWTVTGPNAEGATQTLWTAVQFSASKDATATEIDLAANLVSGTNSVTVGLYADSAGVPGTLLTSFKPTLLDYHTCCSLLVGKLTEGVSLKKGVPYWIAVTTDSTENDTSAEWNFNMIDQVRGLVIAGGDGTHWQNDGSVPVPPAFGVYGQ
jgi:hypothetical protein